MMAEVAAEKRMPPWNADPKVGHFKNARGLAPDEIELLADWFGPGRPRVIQLRHHRVWFGAAIWAMASRATSWCCRHLMCRPKGECHTGM